MSLTTETTLDSSLQLSSLWAHWFSSSLSSDAAELFASRVRNEKLGAGHSWLQYRVFPECLLNLYSLCLLAVVVLQVILAIFVFVYNQDIQQAAFKGWDRLWAGRQVSNLNSQAIDQIQRTIECCGSSTFLDYGIAIPGSCCPTDSQVCNQLTCYKTGCKSRIRYVVENSASWIAYLSIAMAIVEVSWSLRWRLAGK